MTIRTQRKPGTGLGALSDLRSPQALAKAARADRHVIEEVSYRANIVICACGWQGEAADGLDFRNHRRSFGLTRH